jgi:seryl-tRNA synthetase
MLQVNYIRENREKVLERLSVRNFKQPELVDEIIAIDEERRQTQTSLDNLSASANAAAKQIGELMRNGKKEDAENLKAETASYKEQIKNFWLKLLNENIVKKIYYPEKLRWQFLNHCKNFYEILET